MQLLMSTPQRTVTKTKYHVSKPPPTLDIESEMLYFLFLKDNHTRVYLKPSGNPVSDYINASYVDVSKCGFCVLYPLPNTILSWLRVTDARVRILPLKVPSHTLLMISGGWCGSTRSSVSSCCARQKKNNRQVWHILSPIINFLPKANIRFYNLTYFCRKFATDTGLRAEETVNCLESTQSLLKHRKTAMTTLSGRWISLTARPPCLLVIMASLWLSSSTWGGLRMVCHSLPQVYWRWLIWCRRCRWALATRPL